MATSRSALSDAVRPTTERLSRPTFYVGMAAFLLLLVFLGFSRTFYLRAAFDGRPLSALAWAHGVVMSGWFVALLMQTALITARRADIHRRLGWILVALGAGVVVTGAVATLGVVPAMQASDLRPEVVARLAPTIVWGNLATALTFPVLLAAAVVLRRRAEAHKRLMLLASIAMMSPALARIFQWPVFAGPIATNFALWGLAGSFVLMAAVGTYDVATRGRLHPATLAGVAFAIAIKLLAVLVVADSRFGRDFVGILSGGS